MAAVFDTLYATSTKNATPHLTPRPFDRDRDGLVIGEGAATLVLESLDHARARGATILAEIVGYATNSDGRHITNPTQATMEVAMQSALDNAGLNASDIDFISGHGTATEQGDIAESHATRNILGPAIPFHSLKSYFGHSLGAFYARTFAARHPEETLGLVLLDPAHEEQWQRLPEEAVAEFEEAGQMFRWAARMARLGVFRLSNPQRMATVDLPEAAARQIVDITATARYWQTAGAEVEAYDTLAAAPPHGFGDLPVMVISAGRDVPDRPQTRAATDDLHRELVSRSPRATHHVIEEADHLTLLTVDGHARVVSDLIATLLPPDRRPDQ